MKVKGILAPTTAFTLEAQPKRPGHCLARFFENITETENEYGRTIYSYDEYHLELCDYPALHKDIERNLIAYLTQAKLQEAEKNTIPNLKQQVAELEAQKAVLQATVTMLEAQVTDAQMALCDVYELALGGAL